jgi:medium-chain acyl-[acyl-carrier-protein] hydrolase
MPGMNDNETGSSKLKLICIPYSGGSSTLFDGWDRILGAGVEVIRFEYPGWGNRLNDAASRDLDELIADVWELTKAIDPPYALFGHSMGAVISYLTAKKIKSLGGKDPDHVFLSGFEPPHIYFGKANLTHKLDNKSFVEILKGLESIPQALLQNPRALQLYLPAIRHDFYLLESHSFSSDSLSLDCEVSVFLGRNDPLTKNAGRKEWEKYSSVGCNIYDFDGNHFFIDSNRTEVVNTIRTILRVNDLALQ